MTLQLDEYLEMQKEMLQAQLKVIYRHQRKMSPQLHKRKRTSNLSIVEDILKNTGAPLHISKIIETAKNEFNANLERDSIVSALIKKINAGETFIRTAPNTFALKND
jgi:hypothetical protein